MTQPQNHEQPGTGSSTNANAPTTSQPPTTTTSIRKAAGGDRLPLIIIGVILAVIIVTGAVIALANSKSTTTTGGGNSGGGGSGTTTVIGGKWEQVSAQGLGQLYSATKQGDTISFLPDGTLDLGGTGGTWRILANGKLEYTVSGNSYTFDMTFSTTKFGNASQATTNNEVVLTGGGVGGQRVVSLRRIS